MNAYKRHKRIFYFFTSVLRPIAKWKFNFSYDVLAKRNEACIILANHNTDFDAIFMSILSRDHMYFVASEHVFRQGFLSKMFVWAFDAIPRTKADNGVLTVIKMMRRIRKGYNVCIFAEGNRSFDGKTMPILPSTGAFIKRSGAKLITYKFKGGYFLNPDGRSLCDEEK